MTRSISWNHDIQVFVFDKTYHLILTDSALLHPESAPSLHPRVHFFKVYSFVTVPPTVPLKKTKVKHGTLKLKTLEKFIRMIEPGAIYPLGVKDYFLVRP